MSMARHLIWILTLVVGVAGFLCAAGDGYEIGSEVRQNGKTGVIGFPDGAGAYVFCVVLAGLILKAARRAAPWRTSVYLVSAIAVGLLLYEIWHYS